VAGDDFAPAGGQLTDFTEVLGGELPARHGESFLGVAEINRATSHPALYGKALCQAKLFMASGRISTVLGLTSLFSRLM
jgi:hypothetical protein